MPRKSAKSSLRESANSVPSLKHTWMVKEVEEGRIKAIYVIFDGRQIFMEGKSGLIERTVINKAQVCERRELAWRVAEQEYVFL